MSLFFWEVVIILHNSRLTWGITSQLPGAKIFFLDTFNPFHATDLLKSSENIRKPEAFWCFQGVSKESSSMKLLK